MQPKEHLIIYCKWYIYWEDTWSYWKFLSWINMYALSIMTHQISIFCCLHLKPISKFAENVNILFWWLIFVKVNVWKMCWIKVFSDIDTLWMHSKKHSDGYLNVYSYYNDNNQKPATLWNLIFHFCNTRSGNHLCAVSPLVLLICMWKWYLIAPSRCAQIQSYC